MTTMTQCSFCGNTKFLSKKVQYMYRKDDRMLLMNNVPCEECAFCGEQYFEARTLKQIEDEFQRISSGAKTPDSTVQVPLEEFASV